MPGSKLLSQFKHRHSVLVSQKAEWDTRWADTADYYLPFIPRRLQAGSGQGTRKPHEPASAKTKRIRDVTLLALRTLTAGMYGGLSSPSERWFELRVGLPGFDDDPEVKQWLTQVENILFEALAGSNYYTAAQQEYQMIGSIGTGPMMIVSDPKTVLRYELISPGEYCLAQNAQNRIDTMFRKFPMTIRQVVETFGIDNVSPSTAMTYRRRSNVDESTDIVHVIIPMEDEWYQGYDIPLDAQFASFYYEEGKEGATEFLAVGSYSSQPFVAPRWATMDNSTYGYSPASENMQTAKLFNTIWETLVKAAHKKVDPPLQGPPSARRLDMRPGAFNEVGGSGDKITNLFSIEYDFGTVGQILSILEDDIYSGMYNDLFSVFMRNASTEKTATETVELAVEKLTMLGPVIERNHGEMHEPHLERAFDILSRQGYLPPTPKALDGIPINIEFVSMLAQAQKAKQAGKLNQFLGIIANMASVVGETAIDAINVDETINTYANIYAITPNILVDQNERDRIRADRAQQLQAMQQLEAAEMAAKTAKTASGASLEGDNLLSAVTSRAQ